MELKFQIKKCIVWLSIIVILLHTISTLGRGIEYFLGIEETTPLVHLFHVADEANITSWYSAVLLLMSAFLLGVIAAVKHQQKSPYARHWTFLGLIFLYLSMDEASRIHELVGFWLHDLLGTSGIFYYAWVIAVIPILLVLLVLFFNFLKDLPPRFRLLFIVSGVVFVFGALGMEMIGSIFRGTTFGIQKLFEAVSITFEEFLENAGIVIFIYALLAYLKEVAVPEAVRVRFT